MVKSLECYKCGYDKDDDYCPTYKIRWKEKSCISTAKLNTGEFMACVKTSFKDRNEG